MHAKQYIALAQAIKENRAEIVTDFGTTFDALDAPHFINALCDILAADNKNFDKSKFMEALK